MMGKLISKRWYFSLVFLPLLVNYFSEIFSWSRLSSDWKLSVIVALSILCGLLFYELYLTRLSEPSDSDKKIIKDLLQTINLKQFKREIYEQDSGNGYRKDAIDRTYNFVEKTEQLENRVKDESINRSFAEISKTLKEFLYLGSINLYPDSEHYYLPDKYKNPHNIEKMKKAGPEMNRLTDEAYQKLDRLISLLKRRNYL